MTVFEALYLMISFAGLIIAIITLVVLLIKLHNKK